MLLSSAKLEASNLSTTKLFLEFLLGDQLKASTCFSPLNWEFYLQLLGSGLLNVWCMINRGKALETMGGKEILLRAFYVGLVVPSLHSIQRAHALWNMWQVTQLAAQQGRCCSPTSRESSWQRSRPVIYHFHRCSTSGVSPFQLPFRRACHRRLG